LAGCAHAALPDFADGDGWEPPSESPPLPDAPALRVLVFGDWGTGGPGQKALAKAIESVHADAPPDLVLTVGDNFYPHGVISVTDPLFKRIFEDVYTGPFWEHLVFFPTLGNHDYDGSVRNQIRYTERNPNWILPAQYYTFRRPLPSGEIVRFLALDSQWIRSRGGRTQEQLEFIDSVLSVSTDRWVVAYSHHPMATVGLHQPHEQMLLRVAPLLEGRVPIYLSGHNHSTELLPVTEKLMQVVCGGGGGWDNPYPVKPTPETLAAFTFGGWCFLHIQDEQLVIELYNRVGALLYRHLLPHPDGRRGKRVPG
jgi:hypothetical protein